MNLERVASAPIPNLAGHVDLQGLLIADALAKGLTGIDYEKAYEAYKLWEERHGAPEALLENVTNDQLVFLAWAQGWCTLMSPEIARLRVTTDPHSPPRFRVNGPMSHISAFAEAFQCEPGTPMRPEEQCVVW